MFIFVIFQLHDETPIKTPYSIFFTSRTATVRDSTMTPSKIAMRDELACEMMKIKKNTLLLVPTFYFYLFNPISADLFFSFFSYGFRKKSKIINIFDFLPPQAVFRTISLYSIKNRALGGRGRNFQLLTPFV